MTTDDQDAQVIQSLWRDRECLAVDSVQFGDGRVALLEVVYPPGYYGDPPRTPSVRVRSWTRATAYLRQFGKNEDTTDWMYGLASCDCVYEGQPRTAIAGDCAGHGSFGFVAVADLAGDTLTWMAFFKNSNPFEKVEYRGEALHAVTNLGVLYTFGTDDPTAITITAPPRS